MKTGITALILLVSLTLMQAQSDTRSLDTYSVINVSGSISVEVIKSQESKAEITVVKGDIDQLMTSVKGGVLKVNFTKADGSSWGGGAKAKIVLHTPSLTTVDASAGAAVESDDVWESKSMDLQASSGARIAIATKTNKCSAESSSGAKVTVRGTSNKLTSSSSSGASVNAVDLISSSVVATASSGGSVQVNATQSIKASATAGGSVKYKGNPAQKDIEKDKYSGGIVSQM